MSSITFIVCSDKLSPLDEFIHYHQRLTDTDWAGSERDFATTIAFHLEGEIGADYLLLVRSSARVSSEFLNSLEPLIQELNKNWAGWTIAGPRGEPLYPSGIFRTPIVSHLATHGVLPIGYPSEEIASKLSEDVWLVNLRQIKKLKLSGLYGLSSTELQLRILHSGGGLVLTPKLASFFENLSEFELSYSLKESSSFKEPVFADKKLVRDGFAFIEGAQALNLSSIRKRALDNFRISSPAILAIVTRTRFDRLELLERNQTSVRAFQSAAGKDFEVRNVLVSDYDIPDGIKILDGAIFIKHSGEPLPDSRFVLLATAVHKFRADWYWFVDDDDWVFPNEAFALLSTISLNPNRILVGSSQYFVRRLPGTMDRLELGHKSDSASLSSITRNLNQTPLSAIIWHRSRLLESLNDKAVENVTLAEDFLLLLSQARNSDSFLHTPFLISAIELRPGGNTVNSNDRFPWVRAASQVSWHVSQFGLGEAFPQHKNDQGLQDFSILAFLRLALAPASWRTAFALGLPARIFRRELSVKVLVKKLLIMAKK